VPDARGFEPVTLQREQHEFLNVLFAVHNDGLIIDTFPAFAPGFSTSLEPHKEHKLRIDVAADNANPTSMVLTMTYGGSFDTLAVGV